MASTSRRMLGGRVLSTLGATIATVGFFAAVVRGPQPADASVPAPTPTIQQPAQANPATPRVGAQSQQSQPPAVASRPRLRTRGS
jgi:hypothetical protein